MKTKIHPFRLLVKALFLFVAINIIYGLIDPPFYEISAYNALYPGRVRLPWGEDGDPYTVAVDNLDVMVSSHVISAPKKSNEYRVVIIGDSSIWGEGAAFQDSISEQWNRLDSQCNDMDLEFYNLGYPHPSVIKDLIILDKAMEYDPDMIVWFITLSALIPLRINPFLMANSERAADVLDAYDIPFKYEEQLISSNEVTFYQKTLLGRRSDLARAIKLQALGLIWLAIGTDLNVLGHPVPVMLSPDVKEDTRYKGMEPGDDLRKEMLISALVAGHQIAESLPVLLVNEPIFVATGRNKEVRYNVTYPRWAYDQYRDAMSFTAEKNNWNYLDLWDDIPMEYFADEGLHVAAQGERLLVQQISPVLKNIACH